MLPGPLVGPARCLGEHVVRYHVAGAAPPRPGAGGEAGGEDPFGVGAPWSGPPGCLARRRVCGEGRGFHARSEPLTRRSALSG